MWTLAIWLLLGCTPEPPPPPEPVVLAQRFGEAPEAVTAEILALGDPVLQEAAVMAIMEAHPQQVGPLCEALPSGPVAERCDRYATRPHLWTPSLDGAASPPPEAPQAPERAHHAPHQTLPQALADEPDLSAVPADPGPCAPQDVVCLEGQALEAAEAGEVTRAAARCAVMEQEMTRHDCAFRAAEAGVRSLEDYPAGVALCRQAGPLATPCHGHLILSLSQQQRLGLDPADLAIATETADHLESLWADRSETQAALARSQYWATTLDPRGPIEVDAVLAAAEHLPPDARPLLHDLLAHVSLGADDPVTTARGLLAGERPRLAPPPALVAAEERDLWPTKLPGEEELATILMPGSLGGERPTHPDPALDLRLSVLEQLGRVEAPDVDQLIALSQEDERLVRWTLARLLGELSPEHPVLVELKRRREPLVSQRAAFGRRAIASPRPRSKGPKQH